MINTDQVHSLYGRDLYDTDGDKVGSIGQIWDDGTGRPAWASVRTGLFGMHESLVPLESADVRGDDLVVPFDKARIKDAPNIDASHDEPLSADEVDRLYRHYGLSSSSSSYASAGDVTGTVGRDTSGPTTDDAMTRSEERLTVGTTSEEVGRARLRKYVVTEQQQVTVPTQHDEVRIEREPITDANVGRALDGPDISEEEHEVDLYADRAVVDTEAVPVERVRLNKETVTEQETVGGQVRKERIEADLPGDGGRRDLN